MPHRSRRRPWLAAGLVALAACAFLCLPLAFASARVVAPSVTLGENTGATRDTVSFDVGMSSVAAFVAVVGAVVSAGSWLGAARERQRANEARFKALEERIDGLESDTRDELESINKHINKVEILVIRIAERMGLNGEGGQRPHARSKP